MRKMLKSKDGIINIINYVKNYQDSDTGKGYMAGLVISILLYFPALIIALATGGKDLPSVIIACLTYVMLIRLKFSSFIELCSVLGLKFPFFLSLNCGDCFCFALYF